MELAVLTGDLVRSSELSDDALSNAMDTLADAAGQIADWNGQDVQFTRNRGDGWQACISMPQYALRATLFFATALKAQHKSIETRISIATGAGRIAPDQDLNSASGPVFVASGRGLDAMVKSRVITFGETGANAGFARMCEHLANGWTHAQSRAVHLALPSKSPPRREIAELLGISRQAVDQSLEAAGFAALNEALAMAEAQKGVGP